MTARGRAICLGKALEDEILLGAVDANPGIDNFEPNSFVGTECTECHAALVRKLHRVADEIYEDLTSPNTVA